MTAGRGVLICAQALQERVSDVDSHWPDLSECQPELLPELVRTASALHDATADYLAALHAELERQSAASTAERYARLQTVRQRYDAARRAGGAFRALSELRSVVPEVDRLLGTEGAKGVVGRVLSDALRRGRGGQ